MKALAGVALFFACLGRAFSQTDASAAAASGKAPSTSQALKPLEHDWVDATKAGDSDKLGQILADDWVADYNGSRMNKQSYLAGMKSSKLDSFDFGPMDVKVLGNVAVVQGSDVEKSSFKGTDTSGKWIWMDVFVKRDGKWVAVRSQLAKPGK